MPFKARLDPFQTFNADRMSSGGGHLKPNEGLTVRLSFFVPVQEGIKGLKNGRQRLEVARFLDAVKWPAKNPSNPKAWCAISEENSISKVVDGLSMVKLLGLVLDRKNLQTLISNNSPTSLALLRVPWMAR